MKWHGKGIHQVCLALRMVLVSFLLLSCAYRPEPENPPRVSSINDLAGKRLEDSIVTKFLEEQRIRPPEVWSLDELSIAGVCLNPNVKVAKSLEQEAIAAERTAKMRPNPTLTWTPALDMTTQPQEWLTMFYFLLPVQTNEKRSIMERQALAHTAAMHARTLDAVWKVRNGILLALLSRLESSSRLESEEQLAEAEESMRHIFETRSGQGQVPSNTAHQIVITTRQTKARKEQQNAAYRQSNVILAGALGITKEALLSVSVSTDLLTDHLRPELLTPERRKEALEHHPLILAALMDYQSAHEALRLEVAKQVPDISLGPGYQLSSYSGGKVSLALSLPLLLFNHNEGPIAEARARRTTAAQTFEVVQASVVNSMEQAALSYQAAFQAWRDALTINEKQNSRRAALQSTIKNSFLARLPLEKLSVETQQLQAQELENRLQLVRAKIQLEDALRQSLFGADFSPSELLSSKESS